MCLLRENYRFLNNFAYNFSSNWSHFDVCAKFEGDQNNNEILQCIWHRFNHDIGSVIDFIFFSSGIVWNGRDVIWETLSTCKLFYFSVLSWQIIIIGICIFNDKYSPTLISFEMFVLYLELWSSKDSGEMIKDQHHHRLQQTFQIILLPPCTQPPPPPCLLLLYTSFPGRTPLPLLPKAASMEWAWLSDITLAPVSVGWGRGEWGREETQHEQGVSYARQAGAAFKRLIVL